MRTAPLSVLLLLATLLSGCTPELFKGMESQGRCSVTKEQLYPFYMTKGQTIVYTMELGLHNNVVNGLLVIQPEKDNNDIRVVCTSVFGTTLLDARITEKGMKIYDCAEQIKHKKLLRLLEKDFSTLFFKNLSDGSIKAKCYKKYYNNSTSAIASDTLLMSSGYQLKTPKAYNYYYKTNEVEKKLINIATEGKLTKSKIDIGYTEGDFSPKTIKIDHPILKMYINLTRSE